MQSRDRPRWQCRGLFGTHYHELTGLCEQLDQLSPNTVAVREWEGDVIFLHEVRPGAADRSYGVQVAKLAGLPEAVINRAKDVLEKLETGAREGSGAATALAQELPLFAAHVPQPLSAPHKDSEVEKRLKGIHPDTLTPREALDLVYELKALEKG